MPCYQLIVFAKPEMTPEKLATLFRGVARVVFREAGQFRRLDNLGVRPLAYPVRKGGSKYEEVRWVTATFDIAPSALPTVGAAIQADKDVLQYKTLRSEDWLAEFTAKPKGEKLKRFSGAMRWSADVFDPDTLTLKARPVVAAPGAAQTAQLR